MNILAIESASTVCGTALFLNSKLVEIDEITQPVIVDRILSNHSMEVSELNAIAVSAGPGSYTGLRIGMSLAKGLAAAVDIPIISVPTLEVMNAGISRQGLYWVLLHSHKNVVFAQRFCSGKPDSEIECELFSSEKYLQRFGFNLDTICDSSEYESTPPSAKFVGELALQFYDIWVESDLNQITPNYVTNFNLGKISVN